MWNARLVRILNLVACGGLLLQAGGCTFAQFNELLQTFFLGITAAGGYAIVQNV